MILDYEGNFAFGKGGPEVLHGGAGQLVDPVLMLEAYDEDVRAEFLVSPFHLLARHASVSDGELRFSVDLADEAHALGLRFLRWVEVGDQQALALPSWSVARTRTVDNGAKGRAGERGILSDTK